METYLIHFEQPLIVNNKSICHYLGYTTIGVKKRLDRHLSGNGAKLLAHCNLLGIKYNIVKVWPGMGWAFEMYLKSFKRHSNFCPICNPKRKTPDSELIKRFEKSRFVKLYSI